MLEIRHPTIEEKSQWHPLWHDYLSWYDTDLASDITDLTWERFHDDQEPLYLYGAYENQKMIGFVTFQMHRSTWAKNHYCYLEDLFIDVSGRNKGVGTQLINAVKKFAQDHHCQRLYWESLTSNTKARDLYRRIATEADFVQYRIEL